MFAREKIGIDEGENSAESPKKYVDGKNSRNYATFKPGISGLR